MSDLEKHLPKHGLRSSDVISIWGTGVNTRPLPDIAHQNLQENSLDSSL